MYFWSCVITNIKLFAIRAFGFGFNNSLMTDEFNDEGQNISSEEIYIYLTPLTQVEYDAWSTLKWSKAGFNWEFSFSWTCCLIKPKETFLIYYLSISGGAKIYDMPWIFTYNKMVWIWTYVTYSISLDSNYIQSSVEKYGNWDLELWVDVCS